MSLFDTASYITITCHNRLAPYLEKELLALGYHLLSVSPTAIQLKGTMSDCIHLNLHLRCASHVLYSLVEFEAATPDELYSATTQLPWEEVLGSSYFSVSSSVRNDFIQNNLFANLRVKDAIVDRYKTIGMARPDTGPEMRGAAVHLFWKDNQAELFINTSGDSLGRHGYRKHPGKAPMLEALAAATILAGDWDGESPFINPMCGSGTVAIEAALIAKRRAPGGFRQHFAFQHILGYRPEEERRLRAEARTQEKEVAAEIIASDSDPRVIAHAKENAKAAGVESLIHFEVCDFSQTRVPEKGRGVVFLNPEYGLRLGTLRELEATYRRIGDFFKQKCSGYTGYIFTGNLELAKKIGLRAKRRREFYNSKIDCRLLEYDLWERTSPQ